MVMGGSWRRDPIGAGLRAVEQRRARLTVPMRKDIFNLSKDEFINLLREDNASEKMIEQEVKEWERIKAERDESRDHVKRRLNRRRGRELDEELNEYVEAEIRRASGVVADEVIADLIGDNK